MKSIFKVLFHEDTLRAFEQKMENEENYMEIYKEASEFTNLKEIDKYNNLPSFQITYSDILIVASDKDIAGFVAFMLKNKVKTLEVSNYTKEVFYNKVDISQADEKFQEAVRQSIVCNFEKDDVLDKLNELKDVNCLTDTDKLILSF